MFNMISKKSNLWLQVFLLNLYIYNMSSTVYIKKVSQK